MNESQNSYRLPFPKHYAALFFILVLIGFFCAIEEYDKYYVMLEDPVETNNNQIQAYVIHSRYWGLKKYAYPLSYRNNQWHMRFNGEWESISYGCFSTRDPVLSCDMFIQSDSGGIIDRRITYLT